jgi:hypothetical protein
VVITLESVNSALEPLREGFQADGADLAVEAASEEVVRVRLVTTEETCLECIMPAEVITRVLESSLRETFPALGRFELVDTRD